MTDVRVVGEITPGSVLVVSDVDDDGEPLSTVLQDVIDACRAAAGHDQFVVLAGRMGVEVLDERRLADAVVTAVCHHGRGYGLGGHTRGYPECSTARAAARAVLDLVTKEA